MRAKVVEDYELVRDARQRSIDDEYRYNQTNARELLVDKIASGEMYRDPRSFIDCIKAVHAAASANNIYLRIGDNPDPEYPVIPGMFRDWDKTPFNHRVGSAGIVFKLALKHNWGYARYDALNSQGRLMASEGKTRFIKLPGISEAASAKECIGTMNPDDHGYTYYYPKGETIPEYMAQAQLRGLAIEGILKNEGRTEEDVQTALFLIGAQYQYLAIARPFNNINNSISMNLVNAQIKMLGFGGVPHADLDFIAQRIAPREFNRYFESYVRSQQQ